MKKIATIAIALVLAALCLACGDWGVDTGSTSTPTPGASYTQFPTHAPDTSASPSDATDPQPTRSR